MTVEDFSKKFPLSTLGELYRNKQYRWKKIACKQPAG